MGFYRQPIDHSKVSSISIRNRIKTIVKIDHLLSLDSFLPKLNKLLSDGKRFH